MTPPPRLAISSLPEKFRDFCGAFICSASYESRSTVVPDALRNCRFSNATVFAAVDCHDSIAEHARMVRETLQVTDNGVDTYTHSPVRTRDAIRTAIERIRNERACDILVDISTFTHEMLLILLRALWKNRAAFRTISCIYLGAKEYSLGDPDEQKWLSKGCREVRSVIGFPGRLVPGKPTCLFLLVGFEYERAVGIIEEIDPEILVLGKGLREEDHLTNVAHMKPMVSFQTMVENMTATRGKTERFEFSCRAPYRTARELRERLARMPGYNRIVVPLNTKISTIGLGLAALADENAQICYAEPETYNFENYSAPDDNVSIFELNWL